MTEQIINIPLESVTLEGALSIPEGATGIIVFSHGSGSSRHSPRNKMVAQVLQQGRLATLLIDLLTEKEDEDYEMRFDIDLLHRRLEGVRQWVRNQPQLKDLKVGYFGGSTGSSAALRAAAHLGDELQAVVSRGGRTDLSDDVMNQIVAPTLFMVGGNDEPVLTLNKQSFELLKCEKDFKIIEGATHLFAEPGALDEVARLALAWFKKYL